jgi:UPF0755 protein
MSQPRYFARVLIVTMLTIGVVWAGYTAALLHLRKPGPLLQPVEVVLPKGANSAEIADRLAVAGVIDNTFWFRVAVKLTFSDIVLKAGEYRFEPKMTVLHVIRKITGGDVIDRRITLPEGLTTTDITRRLMETEGLYGPPLSFGEGALLPETYKFRYGDKRLDLMRRMADNMNDAVEKAWAQRDPGLPLNTPLELLTLASIVEKETSLDSERATIAGVYINRLKKGMKLQADPTVIYGASDYEGDITRAHLKEDHAYNTYIVDGLPPGPICNPGRASLMATARPAKTDYLFFVADGKGGHLFSRTYDEHRAHVRRLMGKTVSPTVPAPSPAATKL